MSDESQSHGGFAPEPPAEAGLPESVLPEWVAGDTGTRAVSIGEVADLAPDAEEQAAEQPHEVLSDDESLHHDLLGPAEHEHEHGPARAGGHRAAGGARRGGRRRHGVSGCLAVLIALIVVGGLVAVGGTKGYHFLKDHLGGSAADYAGPGTGSVTFEVHQGDTATAIGRNLKDDGVVASVQAFIDAAKADSRSGGIQVGFYQLKEQMRASAALAVLIDHKNLVQNTVLVREGVRVADVVGLVAKASKKPTAQVEQALSKVTLPDSAGGDPEGYLFPATYAFAPGATPGDMLSEMVSTWQKQATAAGLKDTTIDGHPYTVQQLLTVASLVQSEGKTPSDMAKIARVIYNRIENPGAQGQAGLLQIDATVDYALHRPLTVGLTQAEREGTDSPYNTFLHKGLPPGPIGNPGAAAIKAAVHPASGDWYYYVTVNLATGETKFAHTYAEFQQYVAEHQHYCATQSASGCR